MTSQPAAPRRKFSRGDFYRWCRLIHGWLSAVAFLVLVFFAVTGLLLNHPGWISGKAPSPIERQFTLDGDELDRVRSAPEPGEVLAQIAAQRTTVRGDYSDGEQVGNEVFARLQGVRGLTDLRAHLGSGVVSVVVEPARAVSVLNELHRAERASVEWRLLVDAVAILLIVLSVIGYLIFLSLRFRLRTALLLTGGSTLALWTFFSLLVR
jgi:hypothetical protein